MQIVIDIPEENFIKDDLIHFFGCYSQKLEEVIKHGIPLDKIKKEIDEQSAMHMDGDFYIRNFDVKRILSGNEVSE